MRLKKGHMTEKEHTVTKIFAEAVNMERHLKKQI
jgi:hypothetical protein